MLPVFGPPGEEQHDAGRKKDAARDADDLAQGVSEANGAVHHFGDTERAANLRDALTGTASDELLCGLEVEHLLDVGPRDHVEHAELLQLDGVDVCERCRDGLFDPARFQIEHRDLLALASGGVSHRASANEGENQKHGTHAEMMASQRGNFAKNGDRAQRITPHVRSRVENGESVCFLALMKAILGGHA